MRALLSRRFNTRQNNPAAARSYPLKEGSKKVKAKLISFVVFGMACVPFAVAQQKQQYIQNSCVKAPAGQLEGLTAMLPDLAKVAQVRVDAGTVMFFLAFRAVIPAGSSARCDYIFSNGYYGYPPEPLSRAEAEANFKKSGVGGTYDAYLARFRPVWNLVSNDLVIVPPTTSVGSGVALGGYIRLNLDKLKAGHTVEEWAKYEREGWGAYVEAVAKDHAGMGWLPEAVVSPAGSGLDYNVLTVDILPNWAATGGGWGGAEVWNKVHPDMTNAAFMGKLGDMIDRYKVELYRTALVVGKK